MSKEVRVIQVPFAGGQPLAGVEKGPACLIQSGLLPSLTKLGWNVEEQTVEVSLPTARESEDIGHLKNPLYVAETCKKLYNAIPPRPDSKFTLVLGGDHSIAAGSVGAVFRNFPDLYVVWVDAHGDINLPVTSASGKPYPYVHGMPISIFTHLIKDFPGFGWLQASDPVPLDRIIYFGLRDLDPEEKEIIKERNITAFLMSDIDRLGMPKCVELALEKINGKPIHLSFDIDSLDPTLVFSTGTKCIGGLTFREGRFLCERLAATGQLVSMDMVELNPQIGTTPQVESSVVHARELILFAMGKTLI